MRDIFLGIDGGGTHTRAVLVDGKGNILGNGIAGPSNFQAVGIDATKRNIRHAVEKAWGETRRSSVPCAAAFLGVAGVASEKDRERVATIARELDLAMKIDVDHDIRTALAGGLEGKPGIALIAGTGSSCYGRNADGKSWRAGGWGHLLDDVGSGYWLGVRGLMAITHAADGRGAATALTPQLVEILALHDMNDLLHLAGSDGLTRAEIAGLAPVVLDAARNGDNVAGEIVTQGAAELARMVAAVAHNLGWQKSTQVEMVMIGGLMENDYYAEKIRTAIVSQVPHAVIIPPIFPPVIGAAILAKEMMSYE
jgi:N-acetylglucosamine kinase-like BadF-type ATPase